MAVDEHKISLLQAAPLLRGQGKAMGILSTGQEAMDGDGRRSKGACQVTQHPIGRQHMGIVRPGTARAGRLQRSRATATRGQAPQQHHRQGQTGQTLNHGILGALSPLPTPLDYHQCRLNCKLNCELNLAIDSLRRTQGAVAPV